LMPCQRRSLFMDDRVTSSSSTTRIFIAHSFVSFISFLVSIEGVSGLGARVSGMKKISIYKFL
jgi:hypothetical protein